LQQKSVIPLLHGGDSQDYLHSLLTKHLCYLMIVFKSLKAKQDLKEEERKITEDFKK